MDLKHTFITNLAMVSIVQDSLLPIHTESHAIASGTSTWMAKPPLACRSPHVDPNGSESESDISANDTFAKARSSARTNQSPQWLLPGKPVPQNL